MNAGIDDIRALAEDALTEIPDELRKSLGNIAVVVDEVCDPETAQALGRETGDGIMGLYHGRPLMSQTNFLPSDPATIHLYRGALVQQADRIGVRLYDVVYEVLVHEICHHLGYSHEKMDNVCDTAAR